jgi:glutamate formiminotransferase / 5-formyltetrahydrofolate cyclo-ligase
VESELFESVPNYSEGRDRAAIDAIAGAAATAFLLDVDPDPDHHRVVVSIAGSRDRLVSSLVESVRVAVERIDLRNHLGVHPRVGAADVIPIVPLDPATTLSTCADVAREVGACIWEELRVPVYFYGHGADWTLADIRAGRAQPDAGGPELHPTAGAVCVGARMPLVAFNVLLPGASVAEARALARSLRESDGGRRGLMALAFELPGGTMQLSMNLFRLDETTPADVIAELDRRGVRHESPQVVGLCPAVAAGPAAAGRVLEGHLGAAAAREGARRCRVAGGDELTALAERLSREASALDELAAGQEDLLVAAERCAALPPVLGAAGVLDAELATLANTAARGIRGALTAQTIDAYGARVAALDGRLRN